MTNILSYFKTTSPDHQLAYRYSPPELHSPTVVYLYGFRSDMNGEKVLFLESQCAKGGIGFLTFDYSGHGQSSGNFEDGTISQWLSDSLAIIDQITHGPIIIVGSSMGGWLAHLVAQQRPNRVIGLLGIASAPDFTQELMWNKFSPQKQSEIMIQGWTIVPTEYNPLGWKITKDLIEDGRKHLLLGQSIPMTIPIRYLHGLNDASVPYSYSQKLVERCTSSDIALILIKLGDHRLSNEENKRILWATLQELIVSSLLTRTS